MASDGCQIRPGQGEHVGETLDNRNNLQVTLAQQSNSLNVFYWFLEKEGYLCLTGQCQGR